MTEAYAAAGRLGLSGADLFAGDETVLVDRLIDLLLALEPFEIKQSSVAAGDAAGQATDKGADGPAGGEGCDEVAAPAMLASLAGAVDGAEPSLVPGDDAVKLSIESTRAMLARMRTVLDREAARLGADGLEGKAAVDQVALIARTLEKIDQMERLIAEDEARAAGGRLGTEEREQLRLTVRQLILAAAERLAVERMRDQPAQREAGDVSSTGGRLAADAGDGSGPAAADRDEAG
ncbi:hypothetical protein [Hoeflea sp. AS16]|uniref:hypothetical protein n=1 Tax=Hoeflea sp. AS16 TaxID=3135779 RepID=UPI0031813E40